jgi:hypothetical protein
MPEVLQFPVYVLLKDCGDVKEFLSIDELHWMEAIDVENGEYDAWDSLGRFLQLSVDKLQKGWLKIEATASTMPAEEFSAVRAKAERLKADS